ncbi:Histone-lysine N-methyltransferase SETMAR [Habropoda laboriosa]|uniref:Histone-lysine N-methyltransferase SETMAR n=1 Tax=Habropoda laboriosa TaxID=597456 RepID=A0A0L7QRG2_9HYME|nr:Histone-lysine N-methyltransferase SETMAR [Habropoda laboriosa]
MSIDKMHIRYVLFYEFRRGSSAMKTVKHICEVYGEDCQRWFRKFLSGDFGLDDSPRCGRPKAVDEDNLMATIAMNRRIRNYNGNYIID